MDYSKVLKLMCLRDEDVVGCFVVGSRAWGTARADSDFDVVVVLRETAKRPKASSGASPHALLDCILMTEAEIAAQMRAGELPLTAVLFLPDELVWKDEGLRAQLHASALPITPAVLLESAYMRRDKTWARVEKAWAKDQRALALKLATSCCRNLHFAVQLAQTGKIATLTPDIPRLEHWEVLSWKQLADVYERLRDELASQLKHCAQLP
eukprot:m.132232 g.132232  ORF g.132232 m.132232 type:complete len:210 (+) comp9830_c0_seq1:1194-1823(+)